MKKKKSFGQVLDEAYERCSIWQEADSGDIYSYDDLRKRVHSADSVLSKEKGSFYVVLDDGSIAIGSPQLDSPVVLFRPYQKATEKPRFCTNCGSELLPDARFCTVCGTPVASMTEPEKVDQVKKAETKKEAKKEIKKEEPVRKAEVKPEKQPKPKKEKPVKEKKKKKGFLRKLIKLVLVAAILLESSYLLFVDPGYEEIKNLLLSYMDGREVDPSEFPLESLSGTEAISIVFSKDDVKNASEVRQQVSREHPQADIGDITVNMTEYNILDETDELIVRHLGEKDDENSGWKIDGYDFSLASGLSEFFTHAEIRFPVTEDDDLLTYFAWYNEKTKKWEDLPFRMSDDGKQYIVYINHFTKVGKVKRRFNLKEELKRSRTDIERLMDSSSVTIDMFLEYKSTLDSNHMMWPVHLDSSLILDKVENRQLPAVEKIVKKLSEENISMDKLNKELNDPSMALFGDVSGYAQAALGMNELGEFVNDFKPFDALSEGLGTADVILAYYRIKNDIMAEPNTSTWELWSKRWNDLITIGSFVVSKFVVEGTLKTQFGLLSLAWWFGTYCYEKLEEIDSYNVDLKEPEWRFYDMYLAQDRNINVTKKHPFATSLDGLMKKPPSMDDKDFKKFQADMAKVAGVNGNAKSWMPAFSSILKIYKDRPEMIPTIIDELFEKYARSYFDLSKKDREAWQKEANKKLAIDMSKYRELSYTETTETVNAMVRKMRALTAKTLLEAYNDASLDVLASLRRFMRENIDKPMNSEIEFRVVDESLDDPKDFSKSRYYVDYTELAKNEQYIKQKKYDKVVTPMRFANVDKPLFIPQQPGGKKGSKKYYYPYKDNFLPKIRPDDNVVFRCTLYHWIMMGCPMQMEFRNVNSESDTTILATVGSNITSSKNKTVMTVTVNPGLTIDQYLGLWKDSKGRGYIALAYDNGKLGYYEGETVDYNKKWVVIDSYTIDAKTKTLTLYSEEFVGPAKLTLVKENELSMPDQSTGGKLTLYRVDE